VRYVETVYTTSSMRTIGIISTFSAQILYEFLFFPTPAICFAHSVLLVLLPQILFSYDYKSGNCVSIFFQCIVTPSLLLPLVDLKISPQYPVFKHHRFVSLFSLRDQLSNSCKNERQNYYLVYFNRSAF